MAITVGVDTYASIAEADTYFSEQNKTHWTGSDAAKEGALRQATVYLDSYYKWVGTVASSTQTLGWPRVYAYDSEGRTITGIPDRVKDATCELALQALTADLVPVQERGGMVKREKVGPIEVEYQNGAPAGKVYDYVSAMLRGYGSYRGGVLARLTRA